MKSLLIPISALLLLTAGIAIHWHTYAPLLPDRVVSHIDAGGKANQWMDRATFFRGTLLFLTISPAAILVLAGLGCLALYQLPPAFVNVPHKEYWLSSPERRGEVALLTLQFMLWFLFGMMVLMYFGAIHGVMMATLYPERNFNTENLTIFSLGLFFIIAQIATLLYRLYHPPTVDPAADPATLQ
jgi:uncharacterized membrane protein